jgi:hypothetical protein
LRSLYRFEILWVEEVAQLYRQVAGCKADGHSDPWEGIRILESGSGRRIIVLFRNTLSQEENGIVFSQFRFLW